MFKNGMNLFYRKTTVGVLAIGTALMLVIMFLSGRPLKTAETPGGILSLELAATSQQVDTVLSAWKRGPIGGPDVIAVAKTNTYLDFIFIFFYSFFGFAVCRQMAASMPGNSNFSRLYRVMSVLSLAAGFLDIFENIGMLKSLSGAVSSWVALSTATFALLKWALVILVIVAITGGLLYRRFPGGRKV
jgi:hypothetical protein